MHLAQEKSIEDLALEIVRRDQEEALALAETECRGQFPETTWACYLGRKAGSPARDLAAALELSPAEVYTRADAVRNKLTPLARAILGRGDEADYD